MLDKISCPVLVAWGEEDPWTPLSGSIGKFFQQQVAERDNLNLVTLPKTGKVFALTFAISVGPIITDTARTKQGIVCSLHN